MTLTFCDEMILVMMNQNPKTSSQRVKVTKVIIMKMMMREVLTIIIHRQQRVVVIVHQKVKTLNLKENPQIKM